MKIDIITLFPEMFTKFTEFGPIKRAIDTGSLEVNTIDLKDFAESPKDVDDYPYGGGSGMVLKIEPLKRAIEHTKGRDGFVVLLTPQGELFNQDIALRLSKLEHIVFICGRYKGVDERILKYIDIELSIGDYILSGGEPAALVIVDSIARLLPGAVGKEDSISTDSFLSGFLEAPIYTKPRSFDGEDVPDILLSGNHTEIARWRKKQAILKTLKRRPDLLEKKKLNEEEIQLLEECKKEFQNGDS